MAHAAVGTLAVFLLRHGAVAVAVEGAEYAAYRAAGGFQREAQRFKQS